MKNQLRVLAALAAVVIISFGVSAAPPNDVWEKPFQSHFSTASVLLFGPVDNDCFPLAKAVIQGGGSASYMGSVVDEQSHCLNPVTGEVSNGEYTLTAVDGTIFGTYSAQSVPTVDCPDIATGDCRFLILGQITIDGGTGRYSAVLPVSGGSARGLLDSASGAAEVYLNSTIRSDGSIKGEY